VKRLADKSAHDGDIYPRVVGFFLILTPAACSFCRSPAADLARAGIGSDVTLIDAWSDCKRDKIISTPCPGIPDYKERR
jgi:hypothetical protein